MGIAVIITCLITLLLVFVGLEIQNRVTWRRAQVGDFIHAMMPENVHANSHGYVYLRITYKDDDILRAANDDDSFEFTLEDYRRGDFSFD